jgi:ribosomal protein L12E/L44/L45/RPP1/RPP2
MAKKTRKVLKQESQQRAIQQAVANVNAVDAVVAPAPAPTPAPAAPARAAKVEVEEQQEFAFVKSDVRRSLTLAGIFIVAMIALSFIVR